MLWRKESNDKDSLYVDLLKNVIYQLDNIHHNIHCKKNNSLSLSARLDGNIKVNIKDFEGAMKLYNKSICFAEDNCHLSLAYANRSYCFFEMNLFDRCLVDIQYAIETHYPDNLLPKLEDRKQQCLKKLEIQPLSASIEPASSFEANNAFSCMTKKIQIEKNEIFGRLVTAKSDFEIGQTVMVEKAYVRTVSGDNNMCHNCSKQKMNFFPCATCADTMFCDEKCAKNNYHKIECDMVIGAENMFDGVSLHFILRSVVSGLAIFSTIHDIMEFVENCHSTDLKEIPQSIDSDISQYQTFFKLSLPSHQQILDSDFSKRSYIIYQGIMNSSKLGSKFDTLSKQRFLAHLIAHHSVILCTNAFSGLCNPSDDTADTSIHIIENDGSYEHNVFLVTSYFNHSCLPNVTKLSKDNLAVIKAIQPIKKNQQLFVTYLDDEQVKMSGKSRNDHLQNKYGFRCRCELCVNGLKAKNLEMDPDFQYVVCNALSFNRNLISEFKEHCISFLLKYPKMIASQEALYILNTLAATLQKEISGHILMFGIIFAMF